MNKVLKMTAVAAIVGMLGAAGAAYAATAKTPAEIASEVTGKAPADVAAEREQGKTYGAIADEAGKLEEFKTQMLEQRKAVLDQRVKDGLLTQEQADAMYSTMLENQINCDGTGTGSMKGMGGAGFGRGQGLGQGMGKGQGMGQGMGKGMRSGGGFNR
jgi:hypothetical protein